MSEKNLWRTTEAIFADYCEQMGYSQSEVMQFVVSREEGWLLVDVGDPFFPRFPRLPSQPIVVSQVAQSVPAAGPGTELSTLLKRFGIEPTPTCSCRAKAAEMDAWGCDECSKPERIEEVLAVMREEAKVRGLPFVDMAGRMLVRRAISNARRKEAAADAQRPSHHDRREEVAPPGDASQG